MITDIWAHSLQVSAQTTNEVSASTLIKSYFYEFKKTLVEKVEHGREFFVAVGLIDRFKQGLPMFLHCGSFSISSCQLLPHAKISGTNLEIDTCRVDFSIQQLNGGYGAPPGLLDQWWISRQQAFRHVIGGQLEAHLKGGLQTVCCMKSLHGKCLSRELVPLSQAYGRVGYTICC